jgi:hypothetical protein
MKTTEKAQMINEALKRSEFAQEKQAIAVLAGNRVEYWMVASNSRYTVRVSFAEILNTMHGEDMRRIHAAFTK